jgi:hypothetical protein
LEHPTIVPKQPFAFHFDSWNRATISDCRTVRTNCAGHTSVARLHDRIPIRCTEHTPACRCIGKTNLRVVEGMSTSRADWLLGLPLTIFRGMWLVLSTLSHHYHTLRPYQLLSSQTG